MLDICILTYVHNCNDICLCVHFLMSPGNACGCASVCLIIIGSCTYFNRTGGNAQLQSRANHGHLDARTAANVGAPQISHKIQTESGKKLMYSAYPIKNIFDFVVVLA